jgi:hypothetical protein
MNIWHRGFLVYLFVDMVRHKGLPPLPLRWHGSTQGAPSTTSSSTRLGTRGFLDYLFVDMCSARGASSSTTNINFDLVDIAFRLRLRRLLHDVNVTKTPKIILYYRLSLSTWPLSDNKELFCRLCRVKPGISLATRSRYALSPHEGGTRVHHYIT